MASAYFNRSQTSSWIMTTSGRAFYPMDPRAEDLDIADIAHALAHVCRFAGHVSTFYSVAQHSVLASYAVAPPHALHALLHDASEAYLGDVPRPLKHLPAFAAYREAEAVLQALIYATFGVATEPVGAMAVADVDRRLLRTEQRDLMPPAAHGEDRSDMPPYPTRIVPLEPADARRWFLQRYAEVTRVR